MAVFQFQSDYPVFLDGGMGTLLQEKGIAPGEAPEKWNLTHPGEVREIHLAYLRAGSDIILANTFGANRFRYEKSELERVITSGVSLAKEACQIAGHGAAALDIGPTGKMLKPFGDLDFEEAVALFAETVKIGVSAGAELIFIETMSDSLETKAALLAAKENSSLPVFVSNAYTEEGVLLTGAPPEAMAAMLEGMGADAIGVNCSFGPEKLIPIAETYLKYASVPVFIKPNAGLPRMENGKVVYDVPPRAFAESLAPLFEKGLRMAGGCCGTTPDHIKALKERCETIPLPSLTEKEETFVSSWGKALCLGKKPVLIGERLNPTGKKKMKEALRAGDHDHLLQVALEEEEAGADALDLNVGLPEIEEEKVLVTVTEKIQAVTSLPLQLDSASPAALAAALRRYNGKPLINSVCGKKESMDAVFPLAKKYGGVLVALTLDEAGIPQSAEGRLAIAERILAEAEKHGIRKKDLIFDPLAMAVSADDRAAIETLRAVRLITEKLGCKTILGVSNVSFGLPHREAVTASFFTLALQMGLSAAIANPSSVKLQKAYHAYLALSGQDEKCREYLAFCETLPETETAAVKKDASPAAGDPGTLEYAVKKGMTEAAASRTRALLSEKDGLRIVQEEIIPALNEVGAGFEAKTVFLPQLLMAAEAAKAAFEEVKAAMPAHAGAVHSKFVLATVRGDVHDIGKNIVKLLLQNYGFQVTDLGKDVPAEAIVEKTVALHAPLVGLSALMTTTLASMEETIRLLRKEAPWAKIVVGGAVLNREYADSIGADFWAKDAMETVRFAQKTEAK